MREVKDQVERWKVKKEGENEGAIVNSRKEFTKVCHHIKELYNQFSCKGLPICEL